MSDLYEDNILDRLHEAYGVVPDNFNILEEQIDVNLQLEYFEYSKKIKQKKNKLHGVLQQKEQLFNSETPVEGKRELLSMLAAVDNVEAYRTIEAYLKNPEPGLREWAVLALLESRMLLESSLLEETQMFISTGLGGKGAKLRYFTVLLHKERKDFSGIQQRIVRSEFDFLFGKENCEIEEIEFNRHIVTLMALIPIEKSIRSLFGDCLAECNQYGNFIDRNYIVTNVKKLTIDQIERFLNSKDKNKALEELGNSPVR